jgi:hypothetical protein
MKVEERKPVAVTITCFLLYAALCAAALLYTGCDEPEASQAPAEVEGHGNSLLLMIPGGGG